MSTKKAVVLAIVITVCAAIHNQNILRYDGAVNVGLLANLHHSEEGGNGCGNINTGVIQQILAAKWATDVINNKSLPYELKLGLQLHDTCNSNEVIDRHLYHLITASRAIGKKSPTGLNTGPPLLGLISLGDPTTLRETAGALFAFNIPLIAVSSSDRNGANSPNLKSSVTNPNHDHHQGSRGGQRHPGGGLLTDVLGKYDNLLTTVPDRAEQVRAMIALLKQMKISSASLISSNHEASKVFVAEATTMDIRIPRILELGPYQRDVPLQVEQFILHLHDGQPAIALIVEASEAIAIAEHLKHSALPIQPLWLIASLGLDLKKLSPLRNVFHGGIFIEPHMPELKEFKSYFIRSLQDPDHNMWDLIQEYKEEMFGCARHPTTLSNHFLTPCHGVPAKEIELRFQQDPHVSFVVKAVSALTAAFRLVQLDHCGEDPRPTCFQDINANLHSEILTNLRKLSFSSMMPDDNNERTQHHFAGNGRLVANRQLLYLIAKETGVKALGWFSEENGLRLTHGPESLLSTSTALPVSSPFLNEEDRSTFARSINENIIQVSNVNRTTLVPSEKESSLEIVPFEAIMTRTWATIVAGAAIVGCALTFVMFVYVLQKLCDRTIYGNQTMGVLLLLGVMGLFVSVIPWLLIPSPVVCIARHWMHPLLFVLCFSILLVKTMQLKSLMTIGYGGSIPQANQLVSLFFMVMVQVVIELEWYYSTHPLRTRTVDGVIQCDVSSLRFLLLHIYSAVLILLAFVYGVSVVNHKQNFHEGRWISLALVFVIPTLAVWLVVFQFAPAHYQDPSVAISITVIAFLLLGMVFIPKMIAIATQSKRHKEESKLYNQWPQWNSKQSWTPQKWFQYHRPYTPSDVYPLYNPEYQGSYRPAKPSPPYLGRAGPLVYPSRLPPMPQNGSRMGGGLPPKSHGGVRKTHRQPKRGSSGSSSTMRFYHPQTAKTIEVPTLYQHVEARSGPRRTSLPFYYFGADSSRGRPGTPNTTTASRKKSSHPKSSPRIYSDPLDQSRVSNKSVPKSTSTPRQSSQSQPTTCPCCSHGGSRQSGSPTYPSPAGISAGLVKRSGKKSRSSSRSTSLQSLSRDTTQGTNSQYPGTIIIAPDNESYDDQFVWSHRYDAKKKPNRA